MKNRYADYINYRVIETAQYFINNEATVRETAKHIGVSKSTAHKDLTERLPRINRCCMNKLTRSRKINKKGI